MAAIAAAGIGAAAGLVGDIFSSSNAQQTNEMNMQIAQMNNEFNAQQAALNRQFQEQQSDTAMVRRVQDLKNAGLNPLLAVGNLGGAQSMPGSTASSAGLPQLQNPGAAFGQLGQQVTGAMQAATVSSQIEANQASASRDQAQANKTDVETQTTVPANVDYMKSMTGLNNANAQVAANNVEYVASQIANVRTDTAVKNVQLLMQGQNYQVLVATKQALINATTNDSAMTGLKLDIMRNMSVAERNQYLGPILGVINSLIAPAQSAMGMARGVR